MRSRSFLALLLLVGCLFAGRQAGHWLVASDPLPEHADAIVVLAGSVSDRVLEAADLYAVGLAPRVIVTRERPARGEWALAQRGVRLPDSDALRRSALEQLGIPPTAIVRLRRRAWSTESEAEIVARYACRHRLHRLVIVTSAAHTYRAGLIFRHALAPTVTVSMRAARHNSFPAAHWWRVRHAAKLVLSEYQKLANYLLVQQWRIAPCGGLRPVSAGRRTPA